MKDYDAKIIYSSVELTPKEKIRLIQANDLIGLDGCIHPDVPFVIPYDYHVKIQVHNERAKNDKDYTILVIVDKEGNRYKTGSSSCEESLDEVVELLSEAGETDFDLEFSFVPSKNYPGKYFISCTVV